MQRRMNAVAIKIQSHNSGFRCRHLVWLQKRWKYYFGPQPLNHIKCKGDKNLSKSFFPLCAHCIEDHNEVITSCCLLEKDNLINLHIKTTHSNDMNSAEIKLESNCISSNDSSTTKSLDYSKSIYEDSIEGQIHKWYEKNSFQGQIHICESIQSLKGPLTHVSYEKQSLQHQEDVCFDKQSSEDDIRNIQKHLKTKEEETTNNVKRDVMWSALEEKDFMILLACNLKQTQNYHIHKPNVKKRQKVIKSPYSFENKCKLNVVKSSKCLSVNAYKDCIACEPPIIKYCEDCVVCFRPPIHSW